MKGQHRVKVWDLPVRLFHWSLALMLLFLWWSGSEGEMMETHFIVGYLVGLLVLFRVLWGFTGSRYARFSEFLHHPVTTLKSIPSLWRREEPLSPGHNPLGGWMVAMLLLTLLVQVLAGLGTTDEVLYDGPLVAVLEEETVMLLSGWHSQGFELLQLLIGLHIAAVLWHELFHGERIVAAMISGYKRVSIPMNDIVMPWKALAIILFSLALFGAVGWQQLWIMAS